MVFIDTSIRSHADDHEGLVGFDVRGERNRADAVAEDRGARPQSRVARNHLPTAYERITRAPTWLYGERLDVDELFPSLFAAGRRAGRPASRGEAVAVALNRARSLNFNSARGLQTADPLNFNSNVEPSTADPLNFNSARGPQTADPLNFNSTRSPSTADPLNSNSTRGHAGPANGQADESPQVRGCFMRVRERQRDQLLPVPNVHLVFTLPAELRQPVRERQQPLIGALFRAALDALAALRPARRWLGGPIGAPVVLYT